MPDDDALRRLEENLRAAARERKQRREQERDEPRLGTLRDRQRSFDPAVNPLKAHERHREQQASEQERRLREIADKDRQQRTRETVDDLYKSWARALANAHLNRFEESPRIYERMLAGRKIDPRLISEKDKQEIHQEAVREAVARSKDRIREINETLPKKIDRAIDDARTLTRDADRARANLTETLRQRQDDLRNRAPERERPKPDRERER